MLSAKEFVAKLGEENQALFQASKMQSQAYFETKMSNEEDRPELIQHFKGRMINERFNLLEISKQISELPENVSVEEIQLLAKQAYDEAVHYRLVKEVVEHLSGEPIDLEKELAGWKDDIVSKGASLIGKYEAQDDEIALAVYQFIGEGRAAVIWQMMSEVVQDEYIASRYAKIAKDEKFHSQIGRWKLEQLVDTPEAQAHATSLAIEMRKDLFRISCANAVVLPEARKMFEEAYGETA
jgi:rubrerythrin